MISIKNIWQPAILIATVIALIFPATQGVAQMNDDSPKRGRVIYNLDCSQFFTGTLGSVNAEGIDKFVDTYAAVGVTDLFINVNAQKTNYRSEVWESYWDGYDPNADFDQPLFEGIDPKRKFESAFYINTYNVYKQGCDYPKQMIDASRRNKISPWISLRMNDDHNPDRPTHPIHSTFWQEHREWGLQYGLDYEQPLVREHYMKLIKEVCSRYDFDGLELDYQRFWLYFRSGREHEGAKLMNAFVKEAREATEGAAKRLGHPVKLAVRVPSTPWISKRHGLDAITWAKAGWVDLIIAATFWSSTNSDIPIETWKGLLVDTDCEVAVGLEDAANSGASGRRTMTHEEMRGILVSGVHRGADAAYFFNLFTGPVEYWPREDHDRLLKDSGSYQALSDGPRRHVMTIINPWSDGEPNRSAVLPYKGKHGVFRIHIGPKPGSSQRTQIQLKLSEADQQPKVTLNDEPCPWSGLEDPLHVQVAGSKPPEKGQRHVYNVPETAISDGYNLIEVRFDKDMTINWVEIAVLPTTDQ
jgi:hypothetical protein